VCTYSGGRTECTRIRRRAPGDSLLSGFFHRTDSAMMNRAALGIELRATGTHRDTLGVFVAAVTPRGPAETAGVIEGDRIAAINGVDVRSAAADVDDVYTNGLAAHRLTREVRKLTPGARVTLRVCSAGRFRDVVVTTGRASEVLRQAGGFNFRFGPGSGMELRGFGPGSGMQLRGLDGTMEFRGSPRVRALPRRTVTT
ncbi:MAG TPA: PDZ domain-containing protein, partial [Gemmatimonadaceae bacterium]|nr:PDZ domain-containing protein [Gemmatimonadaceae bacterium]